MLQTYILNQEKILKKSLEFFLNSSSLTPKIGCELEFFLFEENSNQPANSDHVDDFILELQKFYNVERERGISQIEIKTNFTSDLAQLCRDLENCKNHIQQLAERRSRRASFASQPFDNDCGNALQFNLSLHDAADKNLFSLDDNLLKNSAFSLLSATEFMMCFLAPQQQDYERFSHSLNRELFRLGKFGAPINLSFGADNRSCAIRIPAITKDKPNKRLEYRLAAAGANPWLCISAILIALTQQKTEDFEQIFGNAFDDQYNLKKFPQSLAEAEEKFFSEENFIRKKIAELSN